MNQKSNQNNTSNTLDISANSTGNTRISEMRDNLPGDFTILGKPRHQICQNTTPGTRRHRHNIYANVKKEYPFYRQEGGENKSCNCPTKIDISKDDSSICPPQKNCSCVLPPKKDDPPCTCPKSSPTKRNTDPVFCSQTYCCPKSKCFDYRKIMKQFGNVILKMVFKAFQVFVDIAEEILDLKCPDLPCILEILQKKCRMIWIGIFIISFAFIYHFIF